MPFIFEWDPDKDAMNRQKHGVSFDEARTVFADPLGILVEDPRHPAGEQRMVLIGESVRQRLLVVLFTERGHARLRIISARTPTRAERHGYEEAAP